MWLKREKSETNSRQNLKRDNCHYLEKDVIMSYYTMRVVTLCVVCSVNAKLIFIW